MDIWEQLPRPFFVLAPMDDVTDTVFRRVVADCAAPDLSFTEFVNVDGLQSQGREKLLHKLAVTAEEGPVIAQIWGKHPENYYKTARELKDLGFAGVDINMGCPVKAVVQNGCCSALINNRELAVEIIQAAREGAASLPVSVKTRLGFGAVDLSWHELLLKQKLNALTIHGRTTRQMSGAPADWEKIGEVRRLRDQIFPATKILGNGDVMNRAQGLALAERYGLDGVMIGRGIFHDPFVFAEHSPWESLGRAERIELYRRHIRLFIKTWQKGERKSITLNKFCKIYISGFDGAKELREILMSATSAEQLLALLDEA